MAEIIFQLGKAHRVIERLRETEEIDRTIIVGIPYKNVHDRKENISQMR